MIATPFSPNLTVEPLQMVVQLAQFCGVAAILLPGVFFAGALGLGRTRFDRCVYGCTLGLATALYLATLFSQIDLRWFYPVWAVLSLIAIVAWSKSAGLAKYETDEKWVAPWIGVVLAIVAVCRFAFELPYELPAGWDPAFHLILARSIQIHQHAIRDWMPFENIPLNYPTGCHTLLVVFSAITGLPLHVVYKFSEALLGVVTTAQIFVLGVRASRSDAVGLFSAAAYGLLAYYGSIDYHDWGGWPSEYAMLLFIAMLCLWLESGRNIACNFAVAILFAALILAHHHTMVTGGIILAVLVCVEWIRRPRGDGWRSLIAAIFLAGALDSFFLIPYALKVTGMHKTRVFKDSEAALSVGSLPGRLGYVFAVLSVVGLLIWMTRIAVRADSGGKAAPSAKKPLPNIHPAIFTAIITLGFLYVLAEYIVPAMLKHFAYPSSIVFTPSRFFSDASYFLAVFAGLALYAMQRGARLSITPVMIAMILIALACYPDWYSPSQRKSLPDSSYLQACRWIGENTPDDTLVYNRERWTSYLTWRRTIRTPMPVSEPVAEFDRPALEYADNVIDRVIPPQNPDQKIVKIELSYDYQGEKILWQNGGLCIVVQLWPNAEK